MCSTYGDRIEMETTFWSENLKGRDHLEDLSVDGRITLILILILMLLLLKCILE
jgi:hypothetical protein